MTQLLFHDATVITMDRGRSILEHTSVAVCDERIVELGPPADLRRQYPAAKVIDCRRKALLPGLVDLHGYLGGSLGEITKTAVDVTTDPGGQNPAQQQT